ncbi:MAG: hypothetical protein ATN36_09010 [Epulopiscium sp. Nele67-Bin005]|nr:MAG: hypothetical protein ATN36_09010 [Epulopiscium sp. Nele67-Bin005]
MMQENTNIKVVRAILLLVFIILSCRIYYIVGYSNLAVHQYNPRLSQLEDSVSRGNFYDENGIVLAYTNNDERYYSYDERYAHVIGYSDYGKYGLEQILNQNLLSPTYNLIEILKYTFTKNNFSGQNITLTINNDLQSIAEESLQNETGAIVMIEPQTGKIKAMYSSPSFNPNTIASEWNTLSQDTANAPLFNRATQGLYPPGSTFKIVSTLSLLENYPDFWQDIHYTCNGYIEVGEYKIRCFNGNVHGNINVEEAFAVSCNSFYVNLKNYISTSQLENTAENLLFNSELLTNIDIKKSQVDVVNADEFNQLLAYIGQGKTLVTPFQMAMISCAIANDGVLMNPYYVDEITNASAKQVEKFLPSYYDNILTEEHAIILQNMMKKTVETGTGIHLNDLDLSIGIKTGTAQINDENSHSWVVGFANNDEKEIAFVVIIENKDTGSVNITKNLLTQYFNL